MFSEEQLWDCDVTFWNWAKERVSPVYPDLGVEIEKVCTLIRDGGYFLLWDVVEFEPIKNTEKWFISVLLQDWDLLQDFCKFANAILQEFADILSGDVQDDVDRLRKLALHMDTKLVYSDKIEEFFEELPKMWT